MIKTKIFGATPEGKEVVEFTVRNKRGIELRVINYGCTITSLMVPDRNGKFENIVLGFDSLEEYFHSQHYTGSIIGRYANRIARGKFVLDGNEYQLSQNQHGHHLHGGLMGFDKKIWRANPVEDEKGAGIDFFLLSQHGEEGYPGNLNTNVRYYLNNDNALILHYTAVTDQKTIINLTQHSYFNLSGGKENILSHQLEINAEHFLQVGNDLIPTGEIRHVKNSPFDFRKLKAISTNMMRDDPQLILANGFDHNWILTKQGEELSYAATLFEPVSGRKMEIHTSEPGIQLYTGNSLEGSGTSQNWKGPHGGLCLETQHFPDTPHHHHFPSVVLSPGEKYQSTTILLFK